MSSSGREPTWWNRVQGEVYSGMVNLDRVATYIEVGSGARDSLTGRFLSREEAVHRRSIIADWNTTQRIQREAYKRGEVIGILEARKRFNEATDKTAFPDVEQREENIRRLVSP